MLGIQSLPVRKSLRHSNTLNCLLGLLKQKTTRKYQQNEHYLAIYKTEVKDTKESCSSVADELTLRWPLLIVFKFISMYLSTYNCRSLPPKEQIFLYVGTLLKYLSFKRTCSVSKNSFMNKTKNVF